jgi:hypothetical protein
MPTLIPVKDANGNTVNMVLNPGYDSQDDMIKMKSVQKKWRDSFTVNGSPDATKWVTDVGTGGSASNSSGALVMANGTTNGSTTMVTSVETFTIPFRVSIGLTLSQRIAGGTFFVEAISVDPVTLAPNGQHTLAWAFEGTSNATQGIYEVQNGGLARLRSAQSAIPTTAGSGVYELEAFADEAWFHGGTLDAATGRANSYRRHQQIPDPNAVYKVRLRWTNSSAPASPTNATIQYLSVQDYAELTAEITAGRGNSVAGNAMNVVVVSAPTTTVTGTVTANEGTPVTPSVLFRNSTGDNNLVAAKGSAGTLYGFSVNNTNGALRYLKLYNKATAPVLATDVPVLVIPIPANGTVAQDFNVGLRFATGIAIAMTTGAADNDTGAVTAGEHKIAISYI